MSEPDSVETVEIIEAERRWVQAHRDLDLEVLESMLAEDYLQIRSDGSVVGRQEVLDSYKSGKRYWEIAESDEYKINVLGNSAILIGRWRGKGENDGESFDYTARFMSVYVKRSGKWLIAADQSTPLEKKINLV